MMDPISFLREHGQRLKSALAFYTNNMKPSDPDKVVEKLNEVLELIENPNLTDELANTMLASTLADYGAMVHSDGTKKEFQHAAQAVLDAADELSRVRILQLFASREKPALPTDRCADCPDENAMQISGIEISFALPVLMTRVQQENFIELVEDLVRSPWNEPKDGVHWLAGIGAKPRFSQADSHFLGKPVDPSAPEKGEPSFDDSIFFLESFSREFVSDKEQARVEQRRRANLLGLSIFDSAIVALVVWRIELFRKTNPEMTMRLDMRDIVHLLNVEELLGVPIPDEHEPTLRKFRKLRNDERIERLAKLRGHWAKASTAAE